MTYKGVAIREKGYASLIGLMITMVIILILVTFYFTSSNEEDESTGTEPATVQEKEKQEIQQIRNSAPMKAINHAKLTARLLEAKSTIQSYEALEGKKPSSLEELQKNPDYKLKPLPPGYTYSYDPATGTVVIKLGDSVVCK
jgi:hypothetical protein